MLINARHKAIFVLSVLCLGLAVMASALPVKGVTPINSRDYSPAVQKLIQGARSEILIMLYQVRFYDDYPGSDSNNMIDALIAARQRGVAVTALIEASGWEPTNDAENKRVAAMLAAGGVSVYMDSPDITSHQKVIIIDNEATVVASLNWSHYSLRVNNEVGAIIWSREFNSAMRQKFHGFAAKADRFFPETVSEEDAAARLGFEITPAAESIPLVNTEFFFRVVEEIGKAQKSIDVIQRSFRVYLSDPFNRVAPLTDPPVPSETNLLLDALVAAHQRGVKVRIILDTGEQGPGENEDAANRLLAAGVGVYYDSPTTQTHAKMLVIDDDKVIVGSTNWTYYAISGAGNEASVMIVSPEASAIYKQYVENIVQSSSPVKPAVMNLKEAGEVPIPAATDANRRNTDQ